MKRADIEIGASEGAAALGLDEFKSPVRLYLEKQRLVDKDPGNEATFLGQHLEHALATMFEERHHVKLSRWETTFSVERPWLRATPDRVLLYDDMTNAFRKKWNLEPGECLLWEGKTTGLASPKSIFDINSEWGPDGSDLVPARHVVQVLVQAAVMNELLASLGQGFISRVIVSALLPGRGAPEFLVHINPDTTQAILEGLNEFVEAHLVKDVPPPAETESDWKMIAEAVRRPMTSKTIRKIGSGGDLASLAEEYRAVQAFEKDLKHSKARLKAQLTEAIGENYGIEGDFGRVLLTAGKTAPTLSKALFSDDVMKLVRQEEKSEVPARRAFAAQINELVKTNTVTKTTKRSLRATWAGLVEEDDDDEE